MNLIRKKNMIPVPTGNGAQHDFKVLFTKVEEFWSIKTYVK